MTTEMKTCSTCKHWGNDRTETTYVHKGCCSSKVRGVERIEKREIGEDEVIIDADIGGWMRTGPLFGCIHHEKRLDTNVSK